MNEKTFRFIAKLITQNKNSLISCHRVINNDFTIGRYNDFYKNSWFKLALLLKEGNFVIMPTDTIYSIYSSILNKETIEKQ